MTRSLFRPATRLLLGSLLTAFGAADIFGQNRAATTPTRTTQPTQTRTTTAGGGGGGGGGGSGTRQYPNATMVGDAMITSDLETRRLIIVTDDDTNENIKSIIAQLDKPKPQVLINVVFVQVTHDRDLDLGAEGIFTDKLPIKTNPTGIATTKFGVAADLLDSTKSGGFYQIIGRDVNATLHALSSVAKTEILSRPSILTRSSQQAYIQVGQQVPIISNSRISDQTNTTINTVTYEDVGIILRVTPFITQEGLVEMIVRPEISSLSATTVPIGNNVSQPVIDTRVADTVIVTPSDQTVVIGGLISKQVDDTDRKIPILGDIPIIGYAFKRKQKNDVKTELLIFLTPHVVQNPSDLGKLTETERAKLDLATKSFQKDEVDRYVGQK